MWIVLLGFVFLEYPGLYTCMYEYITWCTWQFTDTVKYNNTQPKLYGSFFLSCSEVGLNAWMMTSTCSTELLRQFTWWLSSKQQGRAKYGNHMKVNAELRASMSKPYHLVASLSSDIMLWLTLVAFWCYHRRSIYTRMYMLTSLYTRIEQPSYCWSCPVCMEQCTHGVTLEPALRWLIVWIPLQGFI